MYPNATISGGGGAEDWKSRLPQGFDQSKIPAGANGVTKDGDVYIFTKDGNALPNGKYNADGSVFTELKIPEQVHSVEMVQVVPEAVLLMSHHN